ncbi:hypothetical protein, partial [Streptomyces sp. UNOC14_S4]|uniref:hypothetical protein n=1 Tax=Streptomyces sp. UNOC14_S4 TaxID=2872340 RepID=UPI001E3D26A2
MSSAPEQEAERDDGFGPRHDRPCTGGRAAPPAVTGVNGRPRAAAPAPCPPAVRPGSPEPLGARFL